jgi:hypothetical protein
VIRSIENYEFELEDKLNLKPDDVWNYFNTGFMITNKHYKWLHEKLLKFYWEYQNKIIFLQQKYGVGTDQPLINHMVRHNDVEVKLLPYQFNMQDLSRKNVLDDRMVFTKIPGVYHFNAVSGGPDEVNYWLNKTYKFLYND